MGRLFLFVLFLCLNQVCMAEYTFVAAPRGTRADETALYQPIADYLSSATGETIKYVYVSDWLSYRKAIKDGRYDFYFDGPHFADWRATYRHGKYIARLAESHTFVVVIPTNADNNRVARVTDLAGRRVCLHTEPNLATLTFISAFTNPARQPVTIFIEGWKNAYAGVTSGKCAAAVLPAAVLEKQDKEHKLKVIYRFPTLPNQAITVASRVPDALVQKVKVAMVEDGCTSKCAKVLETFASKAFTPVKEQEYAGVSDILKDDFVLGPDVQQSLRVREAEAVTRRPR